MLRKDREITDRAALIRVLDTCKVCRLAIKTSGAPYIVPMNFGYELAGQGSLCLYFHSRMNAGRKLALLRENPQVGFEMDCDHALLEADQPCLYGFAFSSIVGTGTMTLVDDLEEKKRLLAVFMKHQTGQDFVFRDVEAKCVAVWKLVSDDFSGKQRAAHP